MNTPHNLHSKPLLSVVGIAVYSKASEYSACFWYQKEVLSYVRLDFPVPQGRLCHANKEENVLLAWEVRSSVQVR